MFTIIGGDGKEYGPVSTARIQEWISGGRANLQTRARRAGEADWRTLADFPEFGPPPGAAVPPPLTETGSPAAAADVAVPALPVVPVPEVELPELELADRGIRLAGFLIDRLIQFVSLLPGMIVLGPDTVIAILKAAANNTQPDISDTQAVRFLAGIALMGLLWLIQFVVQVWLLSARGQTLAKMMLGIRIVRHSNGEAPGFLRAFLLRNFVPGVIELLPFGFVFFFVDSLFILGDGRRCLHDLLADTSVVKVVRP